MPIEMLLPRQQHVTLEELRGLLTAPALVEPFDESLKDVAASLSLRIVRDPAARRYPELMALSYWMRKAEIARLEAQFRSLETEDRVLTPRGLVFHVPPRNVETIFVYSWLLANLTGNRSVIRISPQRSEAVETLLRLLRDSLAEADPPANNSTVIVSYGHDPEPTAMFSNLCDTRVIWGGDETVKWIRHVELAPHATEIAFPDRYALTAVASEEYFGLGEAQRDDLADQFVNDTLWFDQLACSSPRLVVWCGRAELSRTASADFFHRVADCVEHRGYSSPPAVSMQKFVYSCSAVLNDPVTGFRRHKGLTVLTLASLAGLQRDQPGGGLFFEAYLENLASLEPFLCRRDQTLTSFGFTPGELRAFVRRLNGRAIDRIVPFGQALRFHRFWDGYDLLQEFCRCVHIASAPSALNGSPPS